MKKDDQYLGIKEAYFDYSDSTLHIASEIDPRDRSHYGQTDVFDKDYHTDELPVNFTKIHFYNKKGNHYGKVFSYTSNKYAELAGKFQERFCKYKYCEPLVSYIRKRLNDPDSYENADLSIYYNNKMDGTLIVHQSFRAKNSFGGLMLNKAEAVMDINGNIISCDISN